MAWSEWKKFGAGFDNAELCESMFVNYMSGTITQTISTDKTSFDIILTASATRASLKVNFAIDISGGYITKELLADNTEVSKSDGYNYQKIYHIEKDASSDLTVSYTNKASDFCALVTNAIIFG